MGVLGDSSKVLETPSWSVLLVKCLYRHPLQSTDRLSYCRQTAQLCSEGRVLPWPPNGSLHRKEMAMAHSVMLCWGKGLHLQPSCWDSVVLPSVVEKPAFPGFFVLLSKTSTQYQENWVRVAANNTSRLNQES